MAAAATSADTCAAYVSMLRARRLEEERTRKRRSERRADTLNESIDRYKARERRVRSMLMNMKLKSLSRVEDDLFDMLEEQAQWRHVMRENRDNREDQRRAVENAQTERRVEHLKHALRQEVDAFAVAVKDDQLRYKAVRHAKATEVQSANESLCRSVLDSVVDLAAQVVGYIDTKKLLVGVPSHAATPARGAFDLVPPPVFEEMKLRHVYGDAAGTEEKQRRTMQGYTSLSGIGSALPAGTAASATLAALMEKVTGILFPAPQPLRPKELTSKAFVVVSGPKYSGKSSAARLVAEQLGMQYVSDITVVEECLEALSGDLTSADLESPEMCARLTLAREIRLRIQDGVEVDDDLIAELVLFKIRYVPDGVAGILFDGIPRSRASFEKVEAALSSYREGWDHVPDKPLLVPIPMCGISDADRAALDVPRPPPPPPEPVPTGKDAKKADAKAAAAKKDKKKEDAEEPLPPVELPEVDPVPPLTEEEEETLRAATSAVNVAGLQRVVRIDCDASELFERYCGLRVDADTNEEYHVKTNPPPLERVPFMVAKDRSEGDTAKMHAALENDRETWDGVRPWLSTYEGLLEFVDGNCRFEDFVESVRSVVDNAIATAQQEFDVVEKAKVIQEQRSALDALHAERVANREATRKQLLQIYTDRGVESIPPELAEPPKPAEDPCLPLPPNVPPVVWAVVTRFEQYYQSVVCRVKSEIVHLFDALFDHGVWATEQFAAYCAQPDGKQKLIDAFTHDLNAMPPALRSDVQGKEELHLRADALWEALLTIAEKRRDEGATLVDALLAAPSFLDPWSDATRMLGTTLMQLELERLQMVRQIAGVYYGGIKGEPIPAEEADALVDLIVMPKSGDAAAEAAAAGAAGGKPGAQAAKDAKAKAPAPKKGGAAAAAPPKEDEAKSPEEFVQPIVERAAGYIRAMVERLAAPPQAAVAPTGKGAKVAAKVEAPPPSDGPSVANLAVPLMSSEGEATRVRIAEIGKFLTGVLNRGLERTAAVKADLLVKLRQQLEGEMSAVNGCLLHLRSAVEEEAPITFAIVLSGKTFCVDGGRIVGPRPDPAPTSSTGAAGGMSPSLAASRSTSPLVTGLMTSQTLNRSAADGLMFAGDTQLTSTLTADRISAIIQLFVAVAPDYVLHRESFARIVSTSDWATTGTPAPVNTVFDRFDALGGGSIDWREFIVHLLFWSEPMSGGSSVPSSGAFSSGARNPFFVEGPTLLQLFDLKTDLGTEPLTKDQFMEIELFFEVQMETARLAAYKEALWNTFASNGSFDPNEFVLFLCADEQPLRGVQKAFAMAAAVGDEACSLDLDMMYHMFHFSTCNAHAFGMDDMYSHNELQILFAAANAETLNFQEMCAVGMGRVLLNNTSCFRKRRFAL